MRTLDNETSPLLAGTGNRLAIITAGFCGAAGVMAAASASHVGESRNLSAIAAICLAHGPALLALGLAGRGRILALASILLGFGTVVFAADLGVREWRGHGLFTGAAPLGGFSMIAGWVVIIFAGVLSGRARI
jgi:uncharacterized membrane protein YgdD (TMEM256/DUF423 family)